LRLLSSIEDRKHAEEKILESDLVYVGGGNTLRMMKLWRRLGVYRILESAGNQGTVLSGLSSGAICWHDFGFSDSRAFSGRSEWSFIRVRGLGYHRGIFCPHLDAEKRKKPFSQMIQRYGSVGIACDNNAAIWYSNEKAFAKATNRKAGVHIFQRESREVRVARYNEGERIEFANPSLQLNSHGSGISENGS
jgi:dipeptidase E